MLGYLLRPHGHLLYPQKACMIHIGKVDFDVFVLWSKVRRGGPVRRQARWQVDGAKPMIWRFMMLSYVHHHNIPGAWGIVFTALDNIEVLKVSQNQKNIPLLGLSHLAPLLLLSV